MIDSNSKILQITVKTRGKGKLCLELEGKILTIYKKGTDWKLQIPIDQISISQKYYSKLKQIAIPLLILLACALTCLLAALIINFYYKDIAEIFNLMGFSFLIILIVSIPITLTLAIFATTRYAYINAVSIGYDIEFWVPKRKIREINDFLNTIQIRQSDSNNEENIKTNIFPIEFSKSEHKLFPKLLFFLYVSCLPALFLENLKLFFLCFLPLVWYIYKKTTYLSQPKEYRQAVKYYLKGNSNIALKNLHSLITKVQDFIPALLLMIKIYIEQQDYDNALKLTNKIQDINIDLARNIESFIFNCKKIEQQKTTI